MKKTKKFLSLALALLMLMAVIPLGTFTASAATQYESESNDSYATADVITPGNTIQGSIGNSSDTDYYKITAPANGKLTVKFQHTYSDSSSKWTVALYRYYDGQYKYLSGDNISLNDNESFCFPYIGAVEGGTYYLKVSLYARNDMNSAIGYPYKIVTSFSKSNYYEKEFNEAYSTATKIALGKSYSGIINSVNDDDYYKISSPENGKLTVKFQHTYSDSSGKWTVALYRYYDGQYKYLSGDNISLNDNESFCFPYIGAVEGGTYYLKVSLYARNGMNSAIGYPYKIATSFSKSNYYEKELNETYLTANKITPNIKYSGNINNTSDTDCYKFTTPASGKVNIVFQHTTENNYSSWTVVFYRYSGGEYKELTSKNIAVSDNKSVSLPAVGVVKNGVYYVKVNGRYLVGKNYSITAKMTISLGKPTGLKAKPASTSAVKLNWKKVSGATGYDIYRYSGGKYIKLGSSASNAFTAKSLKAGTAYKFAVRTYKTISGVKFCSGFTYITSATRCKAPAISKLTAGKKQATLTWKKVSGANKYVIYFASKKNGTYKKLAVTKSLKYTKKSLKSKKIYYFKVYAIKTVGSVNIASSGSAPKGVKVK